MPLRTLARMTPLAAALIAGASLTACAGSGFIQQRTEGHVITDDAVRQVRPGASRDLVRIVLGTPQTQSTFGDEEAWYYVQTKVNRTAFDLEMIEERTVLAIYFGDDNRVADKAVYGLEDGEVFTIESRRTPSYGQDATFVQNILQSI